MLQTTSNESPVALAVIVIGLALVGALVPFAFLVTAPALLVLGVRTLRGPASPTLRTVGWLAIVLGILTLVVPLVALVGLLAVSGGASAEPAVSAPPWRLTPGSS